MRGSSPRMTKVTQILIASRATTPIPITSIAKATGS
jgi:hypothetical protein